MRESTSTLVVKDRQIWSTYPPDISREFTGTLALETKNTSKWIDLYCVYKPLECTFSMYSLDDKDQVAPLQQLLIDNSAKVYDITPPVENEVNKNPNTDDDDNGDYRCGNDSNFTWFSFYIEISKQCLVIGNKAILDANLDKLFFHFSAQSLRQKKDWIDGLCSGINQDIFRKEATYMKDTKEYELINQPEIAFEKNRGFLYAENTLQLLEDNDRRVKSGDTVLPSSLQKRPKIILNPNYKNKVNSKFTIVLCDIDSETESEQRCCRLLWAKVGVINLNEIENSGTEALDYKAVAPCFNSGCHRIFLSIFEHSSKVTGYDENVINTLQGMRSKFNYQKLYEVANFTSMHSTCGFYTLYEEFYCEKCHEKTKYTPPIQYQSSHQKATFLDKQYKQGLIKSKKDLFRDYSLIDMFPSLTDSLIGTGRLAELSICYGDRFIAKDGAKTTPLYTWSAPTVNYKLKKESPNDQEETIYYTLIMTDPDTPSRIKHDLREFVHWVIVNIPNDAVNNGTELLSYLGPVPPYKSGLHRYVFSLYSQKEPLPEHLIEESKAIFSKRSCIKTHEWIRSNRDFFREIPEGLEVFLSEWDESVDEAHTIIGWLPDSPFRSPSQTLSALITNTPESIKKSMSNSDLIDTKLHDFMSDSFDANQSKHEFAAEILTSHESSNKKMQEDEIQSAVNDFERKKEIAELESNLLTTSLDSANENKDVGLHLEHVEDTESPAKYANSKLLSPLLALSALDESLSAQSGNGSPKDSPVSPALSLFSSMARFTKNKEVENSIKEDNSNHSSERASSQITEDESIRSDGFGLDASDLISEKSASSPKSFRMQSSKLSSLKESYKIEEFEECQTPIKSSSNDYLEVGTQNSSSAKSKISLDDLSPSVRETMKLALFTARKYRESKNLNSSTSKMKLDLINRLENIDSHESFTSGSVTDTDTNTNKPDLQNSLLKGRGGK